jgi:hypothetical protein
MRTTSIPSSYGTFTNHLHISRRCDREHPDRQQAKAIVDDPEPNGSCRSGGECVSELEAAPGDPDERLDVAARPDERNMDLLAG